ncbi:putative High-affinity methionine permease [Glarea lozoyensis 74030]|uniref:Putative High-affinity methionine permease n=1 Tax=Glarea lozoyensis (strain ATCC 74030 / MF5533) TaxID=1104152 RepID=H0ETC2_GLAL7|nr:putative High-affinity methionine permease [Glarea lozoyensis 74030]
MGLASFWQDATKSGQQYLGTQRAESIESVVRDGNLEFTKETAGNDSQPSYQEASGAPVERESPLGYEINWFTVIFLNIGQMIGTGVFSTPGSILKGLGSVGLSLFFWFIGLLVAVAGFSAYLELASYFPNRSGAQVVYLEQAYPRPKYLFPTAYAMLNILLAFSSSNAIVLSTYTFRMAGTEPTEWQSKGVAIAGFTLATIVVIISNKWSLRFSNVVGVIKVLTLIFISITGFVVLGGRVKSIPDPGANFRDSFQGTTGDASGVVRALVRVNYAYEGWSNSFNMVNEIKTIVPREDVLSSGTGVAALFFAAVFGKGNAARGLNFLVLLSSFGNLVQGVLPYPAFWASTQPFGTPLGPYAFKYVLTLLMILAPPFGDAFDFLVDLKSYPDAVFNGAVAVGIFLIRRQPWDVVLLFYIAIQIILLVMPWVPPAGGIYAGSVSFFYATYALTGIAMYGIP